MMPGCCMGGMGWRRYISPAEELERLHEYLDQLKKEVAGVEARIHQLKGQK
jgi:cell division protein FtsB